MVLSRSRVFLSTWEFSFILFVASFISLSTLPPRRAYEGCPGECMLNAMELVNSGDCLVAITLLCGAFGVELNTCSF